MFYLWRAVDHEGEVLEVFASKRRNREAELKFLKRAMKRYGQPQSVGGNRRRRQRVALVGEQGGDGYGIKNALGDSAEQAFPPTRVAVGARDQHVGT
jgi:putative transposase